MWLAQSLACGWDMLFQVRQGTVPAQAIMQCLTPRGTKVCTPALTDVPLEMVEQGRVGYIKSRNSVGKGMGLE